MRRRVVAGVVAGLLVLLASAALIGGLASTGTTSSSADLPTVSGGFGTVPKLTIPTGSAPATLEAVVLQKGSGPAVAKGDLLVSNYVGELWKNGTVFDSSFTRGQPASFQIGVSQVIPGWDKTLVGQTAGSRLLLVIPPADGYGKNGNSQGGISGTDTLVFVVDILASYPPTVSFSGTVVAGLPAGLPRVSTQPGAPTISVPKTPAPGRLEVATLVEGHGATVQKGDQLVVQYAGVLWRNGKLFDSSWVRGTPAAFGIGINQVIKGWDDGLVGRTVGSRVLLVVPPVDGYGSAGDTQAGIKATDTLVFAVDIIAALH